MHTFLYRKEHRFTFKRDAAFFRLNIPFSPFSLKTTGSAAFHIPSNWRPPLHFSAFVEFPADTTVPAYTAVAFSRYPFISAEKDIMKEMKNRKTQEGNKHSCSSYYFLFHKNHLSS